MKVRNSGFDAIKGLACIAVVFMHCEFPGAFGTVIQCLTRWSVPLFFAVAGYFFRKETMVECIRKAKRIGKITLCAVMLYIPIGIILHLMMGDLPVYILEEFTLFNLASFFIFNSPVFVNGHLWFLFALIYTYLTVAVLLRMNLLRYRKVICCLLLCAHFLLAYGMFLIGRELPGGAYRNFLFEGLPFFLMGNIVHRNELDGKEVRLHSAMLLILTGLFLSLAERALLGRDFSVHTGSVIILGGLLLLASNHDILVWPKMLAKIGEKYSLYIYVIHPAIYLLTDEFLSGREMNMSPIAVWIRPFYTLFMSIMISMVVYHVRYKKEVLE